ncbi:hypothetical protein C8F04DRAFT_64024 [Mycena alexandri]|uniref:F-box domain-containing protein n=1 Tax=Mycena alexandri TaxID=1745969 RepID=A0AAD6SJ54_9AGAR|nr:hypothetical protein C8F04DRAFT_64024 [Mycena alexandri]
MLPRSPLYAIPSEILENIAYELTCLTPLGPPAALVPLLLTCKTLSRKLSGNSVLYSRIFKFKFDSSAVRRRAFDPTPNQYFDQLVLYCTQLSRLREQVHKDDCDDVLFSAYLMMLENDGRNAAQLEHAGLESYLDVYVRTRMWDNRSNSHGWPTDNTASACALWLIWMTTTEAKLREESAARRNQLIKLVLPYVLVPYRYASTFAPQNHFVLPLQTTVLPQANSIVTAHGPYPVYLNPERAWSQIHFSSRPVITPPLVTVAAKLVYFSRRETVPFSVPPHLPLNREHALAAGINRVGPNQDDIQEVNAHLNERLPEARAGWGEESADVDDEPLSTYWDSDWWRLRKCFDVHRETDRQLGASYVPGTFTGLWQGRMLIPSEHHFTALVTTGGYPPTFDESYLGITTFPLFMRIAEHHSYAPNTPVPAGGVGDGWDDGLRNGYFPPHTRLVKSDPRSLSVRVGGPGGGEEDVYEYDTYQTGAKGKGEPSHDPDVCVGCREREELLRGRRAREAAEVREELFARVGLGRRLPRGEALDTDVDEEEPPLAHDPARVPLCDGIQDIIFTGATDLRHGQAWNHFEFYGRLRAWDGMIGILRVSSDPRLGTLFFYGFVVGRHKFVGNWRVASQDVAVPAYESAFSMARREED